MILLVVGLAAVIVVVLIAVFLSIRLGRGDEHDERDLRSSGRDRRRDQDERWRDRDTRRVPSSGGRVGRGGEHPGYGSRAQARPPRGRDYDSAPRRPREAPESASPAAARSSSGRPRRPAAAMTPVPRSGPPPTTSPRPITRPWTSARPGATRPVTSPRWSPPAHEPAPRDRPDSRRKSAPAPASGKSRSRQRGKRDDDDDWPSSEWDKLSDEQYWAELSADKPLATMARPSKPASDAAAKTPANSSAKAKPAARDPRPARPPAPDRDLSRDLPSRKERDQREPVTERLPVRAARQAPAPLPPARREADAGRQPFLPRAALRARFRAARATRPPGTEHGASCGTGHRTAAPARTPAPGHHRASAHQGPRPGRAHRACQRAAAHSRRARRRPADQPVLLAEGGTGQRQPLLQQRQEARQDRARGGPLPQRQRAWRQWARQRRLPGGGLRRPRLRLPGGTPGRAARARSGTARRLHRLARLPRRRPPRTGTPTTTTAQANGGSPAGPADSQATASYNNYLADPLRVYSPPGYEASAPYAEPASPAAYMAAPLPAAGPVPYADGYPAQPYADQAGRLSGWVQLRWLRPWLRSGLPGRTVRARGIRPLPSPGLTSRYTRRGQYGDPENRYGQQRRRWTAHGITLARTTCTGWRRPLTPKACTPR